MGDNHSEILVVGEDPARLLDVATYITQKPFTSPITWWAIDNKYYTANVPIRTAGFNEVGQDGTNPCDAIVAVFDGASKGNFNVLQRWWSECEPEAEVRIVIVLQRGPEPAQGCGPVDDGPGEDAKWMAWATHQLVELVQVDSSQLDQCVDRIKNNRHQEMSRPAFGEGLTGMDRVIEALQTHTWPNLVMKAKSHVNVDSVEVDEEVAEDLDDLDIMFQAIRDFKSNAVNLDHQTRVDSAAELVLRLRSLLGEDSEVSSDEIENEANNQVTPSTSSPI